MAKMTREEEAKKVETKYASLKEDYMELQRHIRAVKKRAKRNKDKKKRLEAEVRFLHRKNQMFTEKDHEEPTDPSVFPESGAKALSIYRRSKEIIEDEPARDELTGLQALMSTDYCTFPEMTGIQPSRMRLMPALSVPHSSFVTPVTELANKKRDLENNGLVSAQKSSKFKDRRNKKIKPDLLVSPEYSAKSIIISKSPKELTEVLATEDKSARHELIGMQTLSSTDDCSLPEMTGLQPSAMRIMQRFKVPHGSLVTPAVIDGQNEKIKANPLVSPEFSAKITFILKRPKVPSIQPTKEMAIEDEHARHELTGMQPLLSTDDWTAPETTGLQPAGFKVHQSSFITPAVELANKKRPLENNGLTSALKPSKVKDGRNKKIKTDPPVSQGFVARNTSVSRSPKELSEALAIEDEPARYELTGMQPLLSTDNCTLPEMTGLQPSAMRTMGAFTVPHRSLDTPVLEPANKKGPLKNNGLVGAQKPSNVKSGRNKKMKDATLASLECGAENLSISKRPQKPTEALVLKTGLQVINCLDSGYFPHKMLVPHLK
jgi:hypothetical protein